VCKFNNQNHLEENMNSLHLVIGTAVIMGLLGATAESQGEMFIYPEKGQTKEQQEQDQFSCYKWAKEQTGFDPTQVTAAAPPPAPEGGQAVKGAAKGAALGAVGGAIAGDAGKGAAVGAAVGGGAGAMKKRGAEKGYEKQVEQQAAEQKAKLDTFNRAYGTCLQGKGYKVG
jgi:hypothetical protein